MVDMRAISLSAHPRGDGRVSTQRSTGVTTRMQATGTVRAERFSWAITRQRTVAIGIVQFGVLLACLFAAPFGKIVDVDYWWHLATGELILEQGIPREDPFSWTMAGEHWVTHEWLSEVIIAGVQNTFGYAANAAMFGAVGCAALAINYALARRLGASQRALALLGLLSVITLGLSLTARPQIFSWLMFSAFLYVLATDRQEPSRRIWLLPPLMLLWANLHLGFTYGLALTGVWLLSEVIRHLRGDDVNLLRAGGVFAACCAVSFATPATYELIFYPFRYWEDRQALSQVQEWKSPLQLHPALLAYHISLIIAVGVLLLRRRTPLFVTLAGVLMICVSLTALRNIAYLALVLLPVAGPAWQQVSGARVTRLPLAFASAVIAAVAAGALAVTLTFNTGFSFGEPGTRHFPAGGAEYIERNHAGARVLNTYDWGGYVIYATDVPVYIDPRSDLYRGDFMEDFYEILRVRDGWAQKLSARGIDVALLPTRGNLARAMRESGTWDEVFVGQRESVFVRR